MCICNLEIRNIFVLQIAFNTTFWRFFAIFLPLITRENLNIREWQIDKLLYMPRCLDYSKCTLVDPLWHLNLSLADP